MSPRERAALSRRVTQVSSAARPLREQRALGRGLLLTPSSVRPAVAWREICTSRPSPLADGLPTGNVADDEGCRGPPTVTGSFGGLRASCHRGGVPFLSYLRCPPRPIAGWPSAGGFSTSSISSAGSKERWTRAWAPAAC